MKFIGHSVDGVLEFGFAMDILVYRIGFLHAINRVEI